MRPDIGLLGYLERGPMPPAIFYNPLVLTHLPTWTHRHLPMVPAGSRDGRPSGERP